jgi:cytoskeletal protein RodZ
MRYLEALEEDRFEVLPAPVFAKGFLRQYARFVGLDPDDVVNHYLAASQENEDEDKTSDDHARVSHSSAPVWIVVAGLVIGLVAVMAAIFTVTYLSRSESPARPPEQASPSPPAVALPAPQPEAEPEPIQEVAEPAVPLVVTLDFTGECWVEARIDRDRRVTELRVQGESLRLEAEEEISLTLGDPSVVRIEANGDPVDTQAPPGQVLRDFLITVPEPPANQGDNDPEPSGNLSPGTGT